MYHKGACQNEFNRLPRSRTADTAREVVTGRANTITREVLAVLKPPAVRGSGATPTGQTPYVSSLTSAEGVRRLDWGQISGTPCRATTPAGNGGGVNAGGNRLGGCVSTAQGSHASRLLVTGTSENSAKALITPPLTSQPAPAAGVDVQQQVNRPTQQCVFQIGQVVLAQPQPCWTVTHHAYANSLITGVLQGILSLAPSETLRSAIAKVVQCPPATVDYELRGNRVYQFLSGVVSLPAPAGPPVPVPAAAAPPSVSLAAPAAPPVPATAAPPSVSLEAPAAPPVAVTTAPPTCCSNYCSSSLSRNRSDLCLTRQLKWLKCRMERSLE